MISSSEILSHIPTGLRDQLFSYYQAITLNYLEHRWEPSELNGGKFCEVIYTILNGYLSGNYSLNSITPKNLLSACQALENTPADSTRIGDRSIRILIPRILPLLYEIRNNRGVGHAGGEVNPNFMDASVVYNMSSWILAELVRIFHNISIKDAQNIVDTIVERKHSLIWEIEGTRRILDPKMKIKDQVLALLYSTSSWIDCYKLFKWVEYSRIGAFKKQVLTSLHKERLIEFNKTKEQVKISPLGVTRVENNILKTRVAN